MLSKIEEQILNACCNGAEIFYFIFAEVNFGEQVFDKNGNEVIKVKVEEIIDNIIILEEKGLIRCIDIEKSKKMKVDREYFNRIYKDYNCITFVDHKKRYGYGPHEFEVTEKGLKLIG